MELLLHHADIHTVWAAMPRAEAAVIDGGRFAYVGTEEGALLYLQGRKHDTLDAQGCAVTPGFDDSHLHCLHAAMLERSADLTGATSIAEVQQRLRGWAQAHPDGWLTATGWNQESFAERRLLTRQDLDAVTSERPLIASRACGHILAANSRALALAGLDIPDGLLREEEQDAVSRLVPEATVQEMLDAMLRLQGRLVAKGITSVQSDDLGGMSLSQAGAFLRGLQALSDGGALKVRYAEQALMPTPDAMRGFFAEGLHTLRGARMHVSCMKLLADGSLGARTAWLSRPYADDAATRGLSLYTRPDLEALVRMAVAHGMPVAIHAIGDAAMEQVLCALEDEGEGLRHGVVHAQITDARQVVRCGRMGLVIYAQPIFFDADIPVVRARVGGALAETSYRWRSMLGAGAHVAFGTDCPVEPFDPMPGLYSAMGRKRLHGGDAYLPEEGFSWAEALHAYTAAGAYAAGEEARRGRIRPGMQADFVLLNRSIDEKEPASLLETGVRATYIGGACVYSAT